MRMNDKQSCPAGVTITAHLDLADGTALDGSIDVEVVNSDPGSINFTAGTPVDET